MGDAVVFTKSKASPSGEVPFGIPTVVLEFVDGNDVVFSVGVDSVVDCILVVSLVVLLVGFLVDGVIVDEVIASV